MALAKHFAWRVGSATYRPGLQEAACLPQPPGRTNQEYLDAHLSFYI